MPAITLWGFNGSTYVRTVRMLLAEKGVTDYTQVPVDVLKGEPKQPEHLRRHPFGKVPVVEVDGFHLIETSAIAPYLDAILPGTSLVPTEPRARARMDMATAIIDSYGYGPLVGVAAYHLFPDFIGGQDHAAHHAALDQGRKVLAELMRLRGADAYLAGPELTLADLYLAPIFAYVAMTPHRDDFLALPGVSDWWERLSTRPSFTATQP